MVLNQLLTTVLTNTGSLSHGRWHCAGDDTNDGEFIPAFYIRGLRVHFAEVVFTHIFFFNVHMLFLLLENKVSHTGLHVIHTQC